MSAIHNSWSNKSEFSALNLTLSLLRVWTWHSIFTLPNVKIAIENLKFLRMNSVQCGKHLFLFQPGILWLQNSKSVTPKFTCSFFRSSKGPNPWSLIMQFWLKIVQAHFSRQNTRWGNQAEEMSIAKLGWFLFLLIESSLVRRVMSQSDQRKGQ